MKKIIFIVMALVLLTPNVCLGFPQIPLAIVGVEGCEVEFNSVVYRPEGDVMILSGEVGDKIVVCKEGNTKVYYYIDPMKTPILYVNMEVEVTESYASWVIRVWRGLRRKNGYK